MLKVLSHVLHAHTHTHTQGILEIQRGEKFYDRKISWKRMDLKGDKISIEMAEIKNIILDKRYRIIKGLEMRTCEGKRNNQCFA